MPNASVYVEQKVNETSVSWGEYMAVKVREILNEYEIEEILTEYLGAFDSMLQIIDTDDGEKVRVVIFDKYDHLWINGTIEREYSMDKTNFKFIRLNSPNKFKDYWFKTDKISDKELSQKYMEQGMVGVAGVIYCKDSGEIGIQRIFPFNFDVVVVNDPELRSILEELIEELWVS